jgi:hypothetical protein
LVSPAAVVPLTRRELRWRIANRLGGSEEWAWQATVGSGDDREAILPDLVIGGLNEHRGLWAWFPDALDALGAPAPVERRVIAFQNYDPGDPTAAPPIPEQPPGIAWAPPLPAAVAVGDRVDLCVLRPTRINDAIDDALRTLAERVAHAGQVYLATNGEDYDFPLPADALGVDRVWQAGDPSSAIGPGGVPLEPWLNLLPNDAWSMAPGGMIRFTGADQWGVFGWRPGPPIAGLWFLIGYRAALALPADDDAEVDVLPEAVVNSACADLAMGQPELRTLLPLLIQQATISRERAASRWTGNYRPVAR